MGMAKDIVDIAKDVTRAIAKAVKTARGQQAANRALQHLLLGGSERDQKFLDDLKTIETAETKGRAAELVTRAARGAKKPATKKPAVKKAAARKPAVKKAAARKPAVKKAAARKPAAKKAAR
jgi:hypothetical protein